MPTARIREFTELVSRYHEGEDPEVNLDQWLAEFLQRNPIVDNEAIENVNPQAFDDL